jgi:hypothetical protein
MYENFYKNNEICKILQQKCLYFKSVSIDQINIRIVPECQYALYQQLCKRLNFRALLMMITKFMVYDHTTHVRLLYLQISPKNEYSTGLFNLELKQSAFKLLRRVHIVHTKLLI